MTKCTGTQALQQPDSELQYMVTAVGSGEVCGNKGAIHIRVTLRVCVWVC